VEDTESNENGEGYEIDEKLAQYKAGEEVICFVKSVRLNTFLRLSQTEIDVFFFVCDVKPTL